MEARHRYIAGLFDRSASTYGGDFFTHFGDRIVALTGVPTGASVLDVGCGTGATMTAVAAATCGRVSIAGVDLSAEMLGRARAARRVQGGRPALAVGDAQRLPFRTGTFDVVTSAFALGYFAEPGRAAEEMLRVLRPDGRVGICVSDGWWFQGDPAWRWHEVLLAELGATVGDPRFRDPDPVVAVFAGAGFEVDVAVVETFGLTWADVDEWWAAGWTHGYRQVLESLAPAALAEYRRRSHERLHGGPVNGRLEAVLVTGTAR